MQTPIPLLLVHYGDDWIRGSEVCALNLLTNLDKRYQPVLWTNNASMAQAAIDAGIIVELDDFDIVFSVDAQTKRFWPLQWYKQYARAVDIIKHYGIQFIHINSGAPCQWVLSAAKRCNVSSLTHLHCPYNLHDRVTLGLHVAPHIVCVSHAVSRALLDEGYPKEQLNVVHNGVPEVAENTANDFSVKQHIGVADNSKVLISVGSLIQRKGFDRVIDAVEQLHRQHCPCHLVIIGDGPEKANLHSQVTQLGLDEFVHFVGEQHNVPQWLASDADVMVSGARSEAFGLVLVEAALAQLPIVAPNVGGISEIIDHQRSGLLYASTLHSPSIVAKHIETLLSDPVLARRLAYNAYRKAKTQFTVAINQQKMETIYARLISVQPKLSAPWGKAALRTLPSIVKHLTHRCTTNSPSETEGKAL